MNLYKLRHLHGFEDAREEDSIVVENGSLRPRKTTCTYKDFGKSINGVWSEAFLNYMLIVNILFGTPELSAALLLFYRQIMTLARSYDWLNGVLPLALGWHKSAIVTTSRYEAHNCLAELRDIVPLLLRPPIRGKPPITRIQSAKGSTSSFSHLHPKVTSSAGWPFRNRVFGS